MTNASSLAWLDHFATAFAATSILRVTAFYFFNADPIASILSSGNSVIRTMPGPQDFRLRTSDLSGRRSSTRRSMTLFYC